jgi:CotH kinase protein/Bacterial Ig-like domain (group 3)
MNRGGSYRLITLATCMALLFAMSVALHGQSFTVSANPQSLTVYPGQTNIPVTISVASTTYTGPVNITLSGLPSGITISPSPLVISPGGSGVITLNMALNADTEAFPASSYNNANSHLNTVTVVGVAGSTTATSTLNLTVSLSNPSFAPAAGQINLPIVTINTSGVPIVNKTTDVPGTITITSADGSKSYLPSSSDSDNTATFHLHGNTTLYMPKVPYHVKLNTSIDLLTQMGLSCPYLTSSSKPVCDKSKSYVLLANYDDKTLLRDWSASALANAIPYGGAYLNETPVPSPNTGVIPTPSGTSTLMPWAPHSLFVELYLNGVYEGNYQLIEEVKVDSHRVNITELSESDTSGDLTGGYLLEIDHHKDEAFVFTTPQGVPIGLVDPDFSPDPEVPEQTAYISNYVDTAETALFSSTFTDPTLGWRAYFDEAAAINFYLVNDIMGNSDGGAFISSDYLYKAADNPFLYMGPIWDFDISSGNISYATIVNPTVPWMQTQAPWYVQWFKDPGFKADVIQQFNTLKNNGVFSAWIATINTEASALQQSQANNYNRWPMLGEMVWPNPEAAGSYNGEVAYMTNFLALRIAYLDSEFNGKKPTTTTITTPSGTLYQGNPVTLVSHVTGGQSPTGTVSFFSANVQVGQATLDGTGMASLTTNNLLLGSSTVSAVYSGDTVNALSSSNRVAVKVLPPLDNTTSSLTTSASTATSGTTVNLTAAVISNNSSTTPTGSVTFTFNGTPVGVAPLTSAGIATFAATNLTPGDEVVQAVYSGDSAHAVSSSNTEPVSFTGTAEASTTIQLVANPTRSTTGDPVQLTATLTPFSVGTSTTNGEKVAFYSNKLLVGTAPLISGVATLSTTALHQGITALTAVYAGDQSFLTSTSTPFAFTILAPPSITTTLQLAASPQKSTSGETVQLTATLTPATSGTFTTNGETVTFYSNTMLVGTAKLVSGVATLDTTILHVGTTGLTVVYPGDTHFIASKSVAFGYTVLP